jgi:hypothetical protein
MIPFVPVLDSRKAHSKLDNWKSVNPTASMHDLTIAETGVRHIGITVWQRQSCVDMSQGNQNVRYQTPLTGKYWFLSAL